VQKTFSGGDTNCPAPAVRRNQPALNLHSCTEKVEILEALVSLPTSNASFFLFLNQAKEQQVPGPQVLGKETSKMTILFLRYAVGCAQYGT